MIEVRQQLDLSWQSDDRPDSDDETPPEQTDPPS
jgi:hypothetical protein